VGVTVLHFGELEQFSQPRLPTPHSTFNCAFAGPKEVFLTCPGCCLKRTENEVGQHGLNWDARLLRVQKEPTADDAVEAKTHNITDSEAAVSK
jgi:hypothetical protein